MKKKKKKAFYIGAIFREEFKEKALLLKKMQEKLNKHIDLSRYGDSLRHIIFVPIAVAADDKIHEEKIKYVGRKKEICLYLKMDFAQVSQADEHAFLQQFALFYLEALRYFKRRRIKDFDFKAFKKDVARLFEANGWLEVVEQL